MRPADAASWSIQSLDEAEPSDAARMLGSLTERSPWLAVQLARERPFADAEALAAAFAAIILALPTADRLVLLRAHPELAPPRPEDMTEASSREQDRLGLAHPSPDVAARLADLNRRYTARHGYPFIVALHGYAEAETILAQFEGRLNADPDVEQRRALSEIASVFRARLDRLTQAERHGPTRIRA